ncbi:MAG: hypothetical protein OXI96_09285 [Acidimicrobiaceae bacterium]|nr:hypothetical protein [Acidimicrobiaceae bacterium]
MKPWRPETPEELRNEDRRACEGVMVVDAVMISGCGRDRRVEINVHNNECAQ